MLGRGGASVTVPQKSVVPRGAELSLSRVICFATFFRRCLVISLVNRDVGTSELSRVYDSKKTASIELPSRGVQNTPLNSILFNVEMLLVATPAWAPA